jgi:hypothetical protein
MTIFNKLTGIDPATANQIRGSLACIEFMGRKRIPKMVFPLYLTETIHQAESSGKIASTLFTN